MSCNPAKRERKGDADGAADADGCEAVEEGLAESLLAVGFCAFQVANPSLLVPAAKHCQKAVQQMKAELFERRKIDPESDFVFKECAGRGKRRFDIQLEAACIHDLARDAAVQHLVCAVLGADAELKYSGCVVSLPGAADQNWHQDGDHLFPETELQLPPHALTVFVALEDVHAAQGLPQLIPHSHQLENLSSLQSGAQASLVQSELSQGAVLAFDTRLVHRGTANTSSTDRALLYFVFGRPWFKDSVNFRSAASVHDEGSEDRPEAGGNVE
eukprot:m.76667 g.76667  ORF g.76667 m.76667 type:complete len:272 (-) comp17242_c0_seq4:26-841(-)